jgi:hypothetical protein
MASYRGWTHGDHTFRGRVVEVLEVMTTQRGGPRRSQGWKARIVTADELVLAIDKLFPTADEAERALLDAVHKFEEIDE